MLEEQSEIGESKENRNLYQWADSGGQGLIRLYAIHRNAHGNRELETLRGYQLDVHDHCRYSLV